MTDNNININPMMIALTIGLVIVLILGQPILYIHDNGIFLNDILAVSLIIGFIMAVILVILVILGCVVR